jgi:hypothetical protein
MEHVMSAIFARNATVARKLLNERGLKEIKMKTKHIVVNACPKSGNHLLYTFANRLVGSRGVLRYAMFADIKWEHMPMVFWRDHHPWSAWIEKQYKSHLGADVKMLTILRDPRDVISSLYRGIQADIHRGLHRRFKQENLLDNREEAMEVLIRGNPRFDNVIMDALDLEKWEEYWFTWAKADYCFAVRFENLVGKHGGGSVALQKEEVKNMFDFLEIDRKEWDENAVRRHIYNERSSHYVAGGKVGCWRNYFTIKNIETFKEKAGDLLVRLGYEENNDWR